MGNEKRPGATGKFPQGKIDEDDEGELVIAVSSKDNIISINFGKKITWIGMDRNTAIEVGLSLLKHAGIEMIVQGDENAISIKQSRPT